MAFGKVRGLLAIVPQGKEMPRAAHALDSMSHRAWKGFARIKGDISIFGASGKTVPMASHGFIHGEIYGDDGSEILDQLVENPSPKTSKELLQLDGSFAFVAPCKSGLIFGRDSLGTKPLYYGKNRFCFALASEKKALAALGIQRIESVSPSSVFLYDGKSLQKIASHKYLKGFKRRNIDDNDELLRILEVSAKRRVKSKVVVSFSGGVDSSLLAAVASDFSKVLAVSVHTKGSHDASAPRSAAKALGLDLLEASITEKEIHEKIPWIQKIAEVSSPIDTSIALGMMFASQVAHKEGCDTMLVGQLADEIFGGYERYLKTYCLEGASSVRRMMVHDVMAAHSLNFDRDEKATSPFIDLCIPYASVELVRFGLSIEPALKFDCAKKERKIVLRKAAKKFGIPAEIAERPKKAFQYSSGISKAVIRYIQRTS